MMTPSLPDLATVMEAMSSDGETLCKEALSQLEAIAACEDTDELSELIRKALNFQLILAAKVLHTEDPATFGFKFMGLMTQQKIIDL
jgi:hypothetical protein